MLRASCYEATFGIWELNYQTVNSVFGHDTQTEALYALGAYSFHFNYDQDFCLHEKGSKKMKVNRKIKIADSNKYFLDSAMNTHGLY